MSDIIISKPAKYTKIVEEIISKGIRNLHVLSDFDRTLTKAFVKGEKRPSLISVLRREGILGDGYSKEAYGLYEKYHKIEIDSKITMIEKKKQMTIWRNKHLDLLLKSGVKKSDIEKVINSGIINLREGVDIFLKNLNEKEIPLVIVSANGLGTDSTFMYLEKENVSFKNINVVSNEFLWDHKGNAIGYKKPLIHVFNKDETVIKGFPLVYKKIKNRKNVILLGDSLGDPGMVNGFEYDNVLKIGFLNEKEADSLASYKKVYDVVITGDGNFSFVNKLIGEIS